MARLPAARWYTGDRMHAMAAIPGGRLFIGGAASGDVKVYDPRNGRLECVLHAAADEQAREGGHTDSVLAIVYNRDYLFTAGADKRITMWDLGTLETLRAFHGHQGIVSALCLIPSEYGTGLFSGSDDCTVRQWNLQTGKCVGAYGAPPWCRCMRLCSKGHKHAVNAVVADQNWVYSGSLQDIQVFMQRGRKLVRRFEAHADAVWVLRLTGDNKLISASSDSTIKLWTNMIHSPTCLRVLTGHQGQVRDLLLQGNLLFSASRDGTVAIWDMQTWKVGEVLTGHENTVTAMTLQNNQLCTCSFDKHANRWDLTEALEHVNSAQQVHEYSPFDVDAVIKERAKRKEETANVYAEERYYTKETKRKLVKMRPHDAVFLYDALPLNFVIDKLDHKVTASSLFLETFVYAPFLIMFIFFFYFDAKIEWQHMISRTALDVMEGNEISRQPWCTTADAAGYWDNVKAGLRPVCDPEAGLLKVEKRFGDIAGPGDWQDWVATVVVPQLWPGEGHSDDDPPTRSPPLWMSTYLIGALRFRTFRVTCNSCEPNDNFFQDRVLNPKDPVDTELQDFYRQCFADWSIGVDEQTGAYACAEELSPCLRWQYPPTGSFNRTLHVESQRGVTEDWAKKWFEPTGFRHFSETSLGGTQSAGQVHGTWPPGGYAVEIPFASKPNDAVDMMATIVDNGFVDNVATRYVSVEYFTYSSFANSFSSQRYYVEVAAGGAWLPEGKTRHFRVWTKNDIGKMVFDIFFMVFVVILLAQFFRDWRLEYRASNSIIKFITNPWSFMEFSNLGVFVVTFSFRIYWWHQCIRHAEITKMPPDDDLGYPSKLEEIREAYLLQTYTNAVNVVFTFLKLLRFVSLNDRLNILTRTLGHCQSNIMGCLVLFVWTTFAYSLTGHAIYGSALFGYRSIDAAFSELWRLVGIGDFDYDELREEQKQMTPLFFWSVQVLCLFILLNFIIAVLSDSFAAVSADSGTLDLDATLRKTLEDVREEILPDAIMRKVRLLMHRKTQTGLLRDVRQCLREHFRNRMLADEEVEAQEHRDLLDDVYIEKEDYLATIPHKLKSDLSEEFLSRVWLDLAWEWHTRQVSNASQESERAKEMADENARQQILRLRDFNATIQDVRARMDDLRIKVHYLVQACHPAGARM
eukprot:TRINITY_DN55423_c0_g1_i1.p1 TRINITY_DN55423_c0_g1~~TRINITY_DN55423_c0_g1_i1.p1  ORF type:complete len:1143 (+),score=310.08 TRINITY_DN55423_c0_g1_i1:133-3561(+)